MFVLDHNYRRHHLHLQFTWFPGRHAAKFRARVCLQLYPIDRLRLQQGNFVPHTVIWKSGF